MFLLTELQGLLIPAVYNFLNSTKGAGNWFDYYEPQITSLISESTGWTQAEMDKVENSSKRDLMLPVFAKCLQYYSHTQITNLTEEKIKIIIAEFKQALDSMINLQFIDTDVDLDGFQNLSDIDNVMEY